MHWITSTLLAAIALAGVIEERADKQDTSTYAGR